MSHFIVKRSFEIVSPVDLLRHKTRLFQCVLLTILFNSVPESNIIAVIPLIQSLLRLTLHVDDIPTRLHHRFRPDFHFIRQYGIMHDHK
jgi:hypothetical protein